MIPRKLLAVLLGAALVYGGAVGAQSSKEAYDALIQRMKAVARPKTTEQLEVLVAMATNEFDRFLADYPDSPEAVDIHFEYGVLMVNVLDFEKGAEHLNYYVEHAAPKTSRMGMALLFLSQAYIGMEEFDLARPYLQRLVREYPETPFSMQAQISLRDAETLSKLSVGNKPIPFTVSGINGETITPDMYEGKVVLIDFWATWCGPCVKELPNLKKTYQRYNPDGFEIIGISLDRRLKDLETFIERENMGWVQFCDEKQWENEISTLYAVRSIPMTFLLDKNGVIRYKALRGPALETAVAELIGE